MANGILVCSPGSHKKNVGDYIQSVAQEQFWDTFDVYVERESLNGFKYPEKTNVIMNGWFMWNPQNFPPSDCINPLFISFHLVPVIADKFLTPQSIEYLKKHEPIGARDYSTMNLLKKKGIDSYFSSCLTLTLGKKYKTDKNNGKTIFVDPYFPYAGTKYNYLNLIMYLKCLFYTFRYASKIKRFYTNITPEHRTVFSLVSKKLERIAVSSFFYHYYRTSFDIDTIANAEFVTHNMSSAFCKNNDEWMECARRLIHKYAEASLVITSRIHCGLPCLAVETPCVYINSDSLENMKLRSPGRMEGLIELFHVVKWTRNGLVGVTDEIKEIMKKQKLSPNNVPVKLNYKEYANNLVKTVEEFVRDTRA